MQEDLVPRARSRWRLGALPACYKSYNIDVALAPCLTHRCHQLLIFRLFWPKKQLTLPSCMIPTQKPKENSPFW